MPLSKKHREAISKGLKNYHSKKKSVKLKAEKRNATRHKRKTKRKSKRTYYENKRKRLK